MTDDVPIPEIPAPQIWAKLGLESLYSSDAHRMAHYVRETAGEALSIELTDDLIKKPHHELLGLAVRAQNAGMSVDVVASLLVFAISRGSTLAAGALAQIIGQRLEDFSRANAGHADRRDLLRIRRQVEHRLGQRVLTEKFDEFRKEFDSVGEAVRQGNIWQEFRRAGVDGSGHRMLAPNLRSLKHLEASDEFKPLLAPLPLWRSPVSPAIVATRRAMEFPHVSAIAAGIARVVAGGAQA
jgi:hypothetical protein